MSSLHQTVRRKMLHISALLQIAAIIKSPLEGVTGCTFTLPSFSKCNTAFVFRMMYSPKTHNAIFSVNPSSTLHWRTKSIRSSWWVRKAHWQRACNTNPTKRHRTHLENIYRLSVSLLTLCTVMKIVRNLASFYLLWMCHQVNLLLDRDHHGITQVGLRFVLGMERSDSTNADASGKASLVFNPLASQNMHFKPCHRNTSTIWAATANAWGIMLHGHTR